MMLFLIGFIDMAIVTFWTRAVAKSQVVMSGAITFVNVIVWYYVLRKVVEDIGNWQLIMLYALGCTMGTVASTLYFNWHDKRKGSKS